LSFCLIKYPISPQLPNSGFQLSPGAQPMRITKEHSGIPVLEEIEKGRG
jgi:hypothetical protein